MKKIADLLLPEDILLDLEVSSKGQLIAEIGGHMERAHAMPQESVTLSLSHREQIGSTGLGEGVAIPHARVKNLDRIRVSRFASVRTPSGCLAWPFGGSRMRPSRCLSAGWSRENLRLAIPTGSPSVWA